MADDRRKIVQGFAKRAAEAAAGVYLARVQDWTDVHEARAVLTRENREWTIRLEVAGKAHEARGSSLAVAFAGLTRSVFGTAGL